MPTTKLVISTYLQYILIGAGALLLFTFVRQLGGVLLTFLMAGVLAYALNPLIQRLEGLGVPRVVAVPGVFLGLTVTGLLAALVLVVPAVGATLAATALYGIVGAVFAVPIVAIISAASRYLRETLVSEHWGKAPVREVPAEGPVLGEARAVVPAGEVRDDRPEAGDKR